MRNPFRRTKVVIRPIRPAPFQPPATDEEVETIRNWSLKGVPTSAPITLMLIERLARERAR